jgi:hypothetical protein
VKKLITLIAGVAGVATLSGCINNSVNCSDVKEYYYVFNVQSSNDVDTLIQALDKSIDYNVVNMRAERPIPSAKVPTEPGRFEVVDMFAGSALGALAGGAGKMANCSGPGLLYKATADKDVGSDTMSVTSCLWAYEGGYSLDFYMKVNKGSKSLAEKIASYVVTKVIFTPEEWAQAKAFDAVSSLQDKAGASVKLKSGFPRVNGEPWSTGEYKGKGLAG